MADRGTLLAQYGRFYGDEHFAVTFTASTSGDGAKRVVTKHWDRTPPLPGAEFAAGLITKRGEHANLAVVLRPSNLIVIECDSDADLVAIEALKLPTTLTVRSSEPYKRHFYFRPAETLLALPYVAFRFESGKITADSGRYFLAPPSLHPSGRMYDFLPDLGPGDVDIVELPEDRYRWLCEQAQRESKQQRDQIAIDPEAKILAGNRRDMIFRYACMLRRWGRPYAAILDDCLAFNQERCEPPVERSLVEVQVRGAMKMRGDQELAAVARNGRVAVEHEHEHEHEQADDDDDEVEIVFEPLRAFLKRDLPPSVSLVGTPRDGTNLLPQYGWVMPWGREGSGKTSILVDLLFHAAAGLAWLGYPIARPLRIVAIVNEGVPGGLQDKLAQKVERWAHDPAPVLDNLFVYASPWGEFTFRSSRMFDHARAYALDVGADYVALDPLHTLGTVGAGAPAETEEFKHSLRAFGVWSDLGVITAHHANKTGMVSGDWGRHPDTVFHVEKDGRNPATKYTLEKARPADPAELHVPQILHWLVETFGYERQLLDVTPTFDDAEALANVLDVLRDATAPMGKQALVAAVGGTHDRVREVVERAIASGAIVDQTPEKRSFRLVLPSCVGNEPTQPDATLFDEPQSGTVEPKTSVDDEPTQPDATEKPPVSRSVASASALSIESRRKADATNGADAEADAGDNDNPFLP